MKKSYDKISEAQFARICHGIREDRESIIKHNPLGPDDEILLWMVLSCLVSFLNLTDTETPCFPGKPSAAAYREAIMFVLKDRRSSNFDAATYLDKLV
ncbi:MAG: hypothetical protein ABIV21_01945 [Pyrinomonadaceae bacterium]